MRHKDKTKGYQEKLRTYQTENRTAQNVSITCYFLIKKKINQIVILFHVTYFERGIVKVDAF